MMLSIEAEILARNASHRFLAENSAMEWASCNAGTQGADYRTWVQGPGYVRDHGVLLGKMSPLQGACRSGLEKLANG